MKEIQISNDLDLKVYINGVPDLTNIPQDPTDGFYSVIQLMAEKFIQDNNLAA